MLYNYRQLIVNQYEAAFCTLNECITRCPDSMWNEPVAQFPYCQSIFHALFFADLYLGADIDALRNQEFHRQHLVEFDDYEQLEDRLPVGLYTKTFLLDYIQHCRTKMADVVGSETESDLARKAGFPWLNTNRSEVHVYNIRHLQHHAAQLILKLRLSAHQGMPWVKSGWEEF